MTDFGSMNNPPPPPNDEGRCSWGNLQPWIVCNFLMSLAVFVVTIKSVERLFWLSTATVTLVSTITLSNRRKDLIGITEGLISLFVICSLIHLLDYSDQNNTVPISLLSIVTAGICFICSVAPKEDGHQLEHAQLKRWLKQLHHIVLQIQSCRCVPTQCNCYDADPLLSACGVSVEKELISLEGCVLGASALKVGNKVDCFPNNGRWNYNRQTPVQLQWWALVNFSAHCNTSQISRELIDCARNKGINMEHPYSLIEEDNQARSLPPIARVDMVFEQIKQKLPGGPPEFLVCALAERKNSYVYGPWKKKCLSEAGIVTQCICPMKVNDQHLTNVLLKINTKPGSRCWPLISRYRASVRTQSPKVEMIDSLYKVLPNGEDDEIMRELLVDFYQTSNGRKPSQIIIFRDGVSESQFNQVLNVELEQLIKAITHLGETKLPKFTLIVAQKNHHTKLFKAGGRLENVLPGFTLFSFKLVVIHSIHPTWGEDNTPEYWAFH